MRKVLIDADLFLHLALPRRKTGKECVSISHTQEKPKLRAQTGCVRFLGCF